MKTHYVAVVSLRNISWPTLRCALLAKLWRYFGALAAQAGSKSFGGWELRGTPGVWLSNARRVLRLDLQVKCTAPGTLV